LRLLFLTILSFSTSNLYIFFILLIMSSVLFSLLLEREDKMKFFLYSELFRMLFLSRLLIEQLERMRIVFILIKISIIPFHGWVMSTINNTTLFNLSVLLRVMKFIPRILIIQLNRNVWLFITLILISAGYLFRTRTIKLIFFYSSRVQTRFLLIIIINSSLTGLRILRVYYTFTYLALNNEREIESLYLFILLRFPILFMFNLKLLILSNMLVFWVRLFLIFILFIRIITYLHFISLTILRELRIILFTNKKMFILFLTVSLIVWFL